MTILEVAMASFFFILLTAGAASALIQGRKMSEDNVSQETATVIAQGILEQVHLNPYDNIANKSTVDTGHNDKLSLKFTSDNTANNLASIQQFDLPWETDATTFDPIGEFNIPGDKTSGVRGVLIDVQYKNGATVIRPARYMQMDVHLTRTIHEDLDNVEVVLTYRWQPPSRNKPGQTPIYAAREIRTIRSETPSY